jgi:hypothetical protein
MKRERGVTEIGEIVGIYLSSSLDREGKMGRREEKRRG